MFGYHCVLNGNAADLFQIRLPSRRLHARASLSSLILLSLQHGKQTHDTEHNRLEPWVFGQQDGYVSHKRYVSHNATDDVLAL